MVNVPKNLQEINSSELKEFLDSFDHVLLDNDGVVVLAFQPIAGVQESVKMLKELGKNITVTTNNCMLSQKAWGDFYDSINMELSGNDVESPISAVKNYLKSINFQKKAFVMAPPGFVKELKLAGIDVYDFTFNEEISKLSQIVNNIKLRDESVGAVISDIGLNLTYMELVQASHFAKQEDVIFICCTTDKSIPLTNDLNILGPHFFQEGIENFSGKKPLVLGKPGLEFNQYLLDKLKINPERTLFIGDSPVDMEFATKFGYRKLLALTGSTSFEAMNDLPLEIKPKYYVHSFGDLHKIIKDNKL